MLVLNLRPTKAFRSTLNIDEFALVDAFGDPRPHRTERRRKHELAGAALDSALWTVVPNKALSQANPKP